MASFVDALENKLNDFLFRAQTLSLGGAVATWDQAPVFYIGLLNVVGNDAGGETETTGVDYARVALTASMTNWNGTHGNTTGASSGTDGTGETAVAITFPTPGAGGWGLVRGFGYYDAATGGSPIIKDVVPIEHTISQGAVVSFGAGGLSVQIDN